MRGGWNYEKDKQLVDTRHKEFLAPVHCGYVNVCVFKCRSRCHFTFNKLSGD